MIKIWPNTFWGKYIYIYIYFSCSYDFSCCFIYVNLTGAKLLNVVFYFRAGTVVYCGTFNMQNMLWMTVTYRICFSNIWLVLYIRETIERTIFFGFGLPRWYTALCCEWARIHVHSFWWPNGKFARVNNLELRKFMYINEIIKSRKY